MDLLPEMRGATKEAIIAVFAAGETQALELLVHEFPSMSFRVQASTLDELSKIVTRDNSTAVSEALEELCGHICKGQNRYPAPLCFALLRRLGSVNPEALTTLKTYLFSCFPHPQPLPTTLFLSRIRGLFVSSFTEINGALRDITSDDHIERMSAAEFLYEAIRDTPSVLESLLMLPLEDFRNIKDVRAVFRAVSGSDDASGLKTFIERISTPERGVGDSFRRVVEKLAQLDPKGTVEWMRCRLKIATNPDAKRQVLVAFQILAEAKAETISTKDVQECMQIGFYGKGVTHELRRVFCTGIGKIGEIDSDLGVDIFKDVFRTGDRQYISASMKSLASARSSSFVVRILEQLLAFMGSKGKFVTLGTFLESMFDQEGNIRVAVLQRLLVKDTLQVRFELMDSTVISRLLQFARNTAGLDPTNALALAMACKVNDRSNYAMLAAVYKNVGIYTSDPVERRNCLAGLLELSTIPNSRVRNSLDSALKQLDVTLPHRFVVDAVISKIAAVRTWPEEALIDLIQASIKMPSWTVEDSNKLIGAVRLSVRAQALLHSR